MQLKRNKEMEFEILKKSYKKHIIVGALAICVIGGALTFTTTRAKYKIDGFIDLAKGKVNYKPYDFKIMAMYQSDDSTNYTEINNMPGNGYTINEDKSYCTTDNKTQVKAKAYTNDSGELVLKNLTKSDKCYLYFDKQKLGADQVLANVNVKKEIPNFSKVATTDEGVYAVSDGMYGGISYYWRGAVSDNYVKFANFCWRIVRINGDKSIRLIYDGTTCHANGTKTSESIAKTNIKYNTTWNQSNHVGWTYSGTNQRPSNTTNEVASNAKIELESWYLANVMGINARKVAQGKYCNDRDVGQPLASDNGYAILWSINGTSFRYAGAKRLWETYTPTLSCPSEDVYILNVGLITADEVELAGGNNLDNNQYYLCNGQYYWTMSPNYWGNGPCVFYVNDSGKIVTNDVAYNIGLRPVINLRSDVTFSNGNGTLNNPYVVE